MQDFGDYRTQVYPTDHQQPEVLLVGAGPSSGALAVPAPLSLQSESHTSNFPDRREKIQLEEAINRRYNPASRLEVLS